MLIILIRTGVPINKGEGRARKGAEDIAGDASGQQGSATDKVCRGMLLEQHPTLAIS